MDNATFTMSDSEKPLYNPFETDSGGDQITFRSGLLKDDGWPSVPPFGEGEFAVRESLGVLPNTTLVRDSLTSDFLSTNFGDFQIGSPRESLGILNISSMDLGRESIGIFDINQPLFKRDCNDRTEHLHQENLIPRILCHGIEDKANSTSFAELNRAFLFPHSRKISGVSSGSSANPSFNSRSLEEYSKISSISSIQKDPSSMSIMGIGNPFNEAFQICQGTSSYSVSYKSSNTHYSFASDLEIMRKRIQSLPVALEENNNPLCGVAFGNKTENVSFDDGLICRGVEEEKDLDDSVFFYDKRGRKNEDATSFNWEEKSFDGERYLLDCTPQPDWGECDSSKSNVDEKDKSPIYSRECISKKVDKMLGMQPVNLEERLKLKNVSKCDSASSFNTSQNISKISRASQCSIPENMSCASNNFSQDLSKISRNSEENISRLIKNLSDIINEKENLSKSQRNESHHMLSCLANILRDSTNKGTNSEDSGHSSVDDPNMDDKNDKMESDGTGKICEALDLSCKRTGGEANKSISHSVKNPPPYVVYSPNNGRVAETITKPNNVSQSSNQSNASAKSITSLRRHSSISLGPEKFKRAKSGIVSKKEPLRAVLPVENMAKDTRGIRKSAQLAVTPERNDGGNKMTLKSKKTSTPLQEPKLKPVAASTPASRQSKDSAVSPAAKPKFSRSFSHQSKLSSSTEHPSSGRKSGDNVASKVTVKKPINSNTKFVRRNSITESTLNHEKTSEDLGPQKLKRSFSTGRESKICSALSKARQNILSSPYYRKSTDGNEADPKRFSFDAKVSQSRKVGKENLKP